MLHSFIQRPNYGELARVAHSTCATVTTIFLLSRLWARKTQYKGLWWDDYFLIAAWACLLTGNGAAASAPGFGFNILAGTADGWRMVFTSVTFFYVGGALAKTAFSLTLMRLSSEGTRIILGAVIAVTCVFGIAQSIFTWIKICDTTAVDTGLEGRCVAIDTLVWVHVGCSAFTICSDLVLAYLPWRIVSKLHIPGKEKRAVGTSMSLVGAGAILCIARSVPW